jgi:hypothetical protein
MREREVIWASAGPMMLQLRWWDCLEELSRSARAHLPFWVAVGSSSRHQPMAPSCGMFAGACTLPTLRILKPCVMPRRLKSRPFQGALVPSALRNSWSSSSARSPCTGGNSELMLVTARPGSTCWTDGGGSASLLVARPERTMKGRLWTTKSDGYASMSPRAQVIAPCQNEGRGRLWRGRAEVLRSGLCLSHAKSQIRAWLC